MHSESATLEHAFSSPTTLTFDLLDLKITATPGCLTVFSCVPNSLWLYSFYLSWIIVQIHCE